MKKGHIIPIVIGLATVSFVAYNFKDRFTTATASTTDFLVDVEPIAVEAPTKNEIFLVDDSFDLGHHDKGEEVQFELAVRNEGSEAAQLKRIETSCGCTTAEDIYKTAKLPAGETTLIPFTMDVKDIGPRSFDITFVLESGDQFVGVVHIIGDATYELSTGEVDFGDIDLFAKEPVRQTVTFTPVRHTLGGEISSDLDWLDIQLKESDSAIEILLSINPSSLSVGKISGSVYVPTTDPNSPFGEIKVVATGITPIVPSPSTVYLFGKAEQSVRFSYRDGTSVQVSLANEPGSGITAKLDVDKVTLQNTNGEAVKENTVLIVQDKDGKKGMVQIHAYGG